MGDYKKKFKRRANVPMIKTTDPEGHYVVESIGNTTSFHEEGTLTFNGNNGILTWNSGDITHLNFTQENFAIMYDAESEVLTLTADDKNIFYDIKALIDIIKEKGITVEEAEADANKEIEEEKENE